MSKFKRGKINYFYSRKINASKAVNTEAIHLQPEWLKGTGSVVGPQHIVVHVEESSGLRHMECMRTHREHPSGSPLKEEL